MPTPFAVARTWAWTEVERKKPLPAGISLEASSRSSTWSAFSM